MKYIYLIIVISIITAFGLRAQQDAQYTQYMYNTIAINPAYAGSSGMFKIAALHRSQWAGFDGAPKTQTLSFNSPISKKVGLGFSFTNDEIGNGTNQDTYFDGVFSYALTINKERKLFLGLKAGGHLLKVNFNNLIKYGSNPSPNIQNISNRFTPNIGAGAYFLSKKFYAGLSIPNFFNTQHFNRFGAAFSTLDTERITLYFIGGILLEPSQFIKLKPAVLFKATKGAPVQADVSLTALFNDKISLGTAYRSNGAISGLAGFQVSDKLMLGLSYDKETAKLAGTVFNHGTYEVFLKYEFMTRFIRVATCKCF